MQKPRIFVKFLENGIEEINSHGGLKIKGVQMCKTYVYYISDIRFDQP